MAINEAILKLPPMDKLADALQRSSTTTTSSLTTSMSTSTTTECDSRALKPEEGSDKILPSPATLHAITKEIENSFKESSSIESPASASTSVGSPSIVSRFTFSGSLNKIPATQPYQYKGSPSSSVKSNSAPGRVSSMDPHFTMSIHKVTQGNFCVRPQDELNNKAPTVEEDTRKKSTTTIEDIERLHQIRSVIMESKTGERLKFGFIGSNSLGNETRYRPEAIQESSKERRKSAGDEDIFKQINSNVNVRMRTDSGKHLSDHEILEQVRFLFLVPYETQEIFASRSL